MIPLPLSLYQTFNQDIIKELTQMSTVKGYMYYFLLLNDLL